MDDLTIWLYSIICEDEVLPFFLQHYAPICDRLTLYNNGDPDYGAELIKQYPNVILLDYPGPRRQLDSVSAATFAERTCRLARSWADWVIWVDCDEFLWSGPVPLRDTIRSYARRGIRAVAASGYQMIADSFPKSDAPLVEQIRYGFRDTEYDKMCLFDPYLDFRWKPGHHSVRMYTPGVTPQQGELRLLHYRYLGAEYFKRRNAYNYANLSEAELAAHRSYGDAPDYVSGKYSDVWYRHMSAYMTDVVSQNWIGVES